VIGCISLFDTTHITRLYNSLLRTYEYPQSHLQCRCLVAVPTVDGPFPLGFRTVPGRSYQLLIVTAHNNWAPAVIWLFTDWLTQLSSTVLTELHSRLVLFKTSRHGPHRKHRSSVVPLLRWCLLAEPIISVSNCCRGNVMDVVYLLVSQSLPRNGSTCHSMHTCFTTQRFWIFYSLHP
jgi:hypothetical protein